MEITLTLYCNMHLFWGLTNQLESRICIQTWMFILQSDSTEILQAMMEKARYNRNVARCTDGKGYLHGRKTGTQTRWWILPIVHFSTTDISFFFLRCKTFMVFLDSFCSTVKGQVCIFQCFDFSFFQWWCVCVISMDVLSCCPSSTLLGKYVHIH